MRIYEMEEERRTEELTEVWERSVKATHSFLPDTAREELKKIVPERTTEGLWRALWGWTGRNWKCCSLRRRRADRGWDGSCWNMVYRHLAFLSLG